MQSVEILTGGIDAEYNALGGVINIIPKGGGDQFHALAAALREPLPAVQPGQPGRQPVGGRAALQRDRRRTDPALRGARINIGGPIIKRKLWYGLSYQYIYASATRWPRDRRWASPPMTSATPTRKFVAHYIRARIDFAPAPKHRFRLSLFTDPTVIDNTGQSNNYLGAGREHQDQGGKFASLRWDWLAKENLTASRIWASTCAASRTAPRAVSARSTPRLRPVLAGQLHLRLDPAPARQQRRRHRLVPGADLRASRSQPGPVRPVGFAARVFPGAPQRQGRHPGPVRLAPPDRADAGRRACLQRHAGDGAAARGRPVQSGHRAKLRLAAPRSRTSRHARAATRRVCSSRTTGGRRCSG